MDINTRTQSFKYMNVERRLNRCCVLSGEMIMAPVTVSGIQHSHIDNSLNWIGIHLVYVLLLNVWPVVRSNVRWLEVGHRQAAQVFRAPVIFWANMRTIVRRMYARNILLCCVMRHPKTIGVGFGKYVYNWGNLLCPDFLVS